MLGRCTQSGDDAAVADRALGHLVAGRGAVEDGHRIGLVADEVAVLCGWRDVRVVVADDLWGLDLVRSVGAFHGEPGRSLRSCLDGTSGLFAPRLVRPIRRTTFVCDLARRLGHVLVGGVGGFPGLLLVRGGQRPPCLQPGRDTFGFLAGPIGRGKRAPAGRLCLFDLLDTHIGAVGPLDAHAHATVWPGDSGSPRGVRRFSGVRGSISWIVIAVLLARAGVISGGLLHVRIQNVPELPVRIKRPAASGHRIRTRMNAGCDCRPVTWP